MEENWIEVYSETLQHEALVRITDETIIPVSVNGLVILIPPILS